MDEIVGALYNEARNVQLKRETFRKEDSNLIVGSKIYFADTTFDGFILSNRNDIIVKALFYT